MIFTLMDILATAIPRLSGSVEGYLSPFKFKGQVLTLTPLQYQPLLEASLNLQMSHR